jgi:PAS domain-containing protein
MRSWEEVHRLHGQENKSGREIARLLGMSRNTVRRLLALSEPPRYRRFSSGSPLSAYRLEIRSLLEQDARAPATVIRRRLMELGYTGGITILKEYLAAVRLQFPSVPGCWVSAQPQAPTSGEEHGTNLEPGMNLISSDFEIIMVNRTNERLFKKPMLQMLGKKCYREFERRDEVCPHCPGAAALATGNPHTVETRGIRDDETRYAVRLTAYPILGPLGTSVGFVEVEEDITERKRSEQLVGLLEDLQTSLAATHDINGAVRQALNVAFSLEGVDFGCAYIWEPATAEYRTIAQRGVTRDLAETLARSTSESTPAGGPVLSTFSHPSEDLAIQRGPRAVALVPISHEGQVVARLLLGSSAYAEFPPGTNAALEGLGRIVGGAISRFRAQQLKKETRDEIETLLRALPFPVWAMDQNGTVTLWNPEAQRAFGWKAAEILNRPLPLSLSDMGGGEYECLRKDGRPARIRPVMVPAPRAIGSYAENVTIVVEIPVDPEPSRSPDRDTPPPPSRSAPLRVLVVDHERRDRITLVRILRRLGCLVTACVSAEDGLEHYRSASGPRRRFDVVVAELLMPTGLGGLDLASHLLKIDPAARVILSASSPIVGSASYGLAGTLQRPYEAEAVQAILDTLWPEFAQSPRLT